MKPLSPEAQVEQGIATGRYVAPVRPLAECHRARLPVLREGALDYRDIPSRMGDVLVPHGAKVAA